MTRWYWLSAFLVFLCCVVVIARTLTLIIFKGLTNGEVDPSSALRGDGPQDKVASGETPSVGGLHALRKKL